MTVTGFDENEVVELVEGGGSKGRGGGRGRGAALTDAMVDSVCGGGGVDVLESSPASDQQ